MSLHISGIDFKFQPSLLKFVSFVCLILFISLYAIYVTTHHNNLEHSNVKLHAKLILCLPHCIFMIEL